MEVLFPAAALAASQPSDTDVLLRQIGKLRLANNGKAVKEVLCKCTKRDGMPKQWHHIFTNKGNAKGFFDYFSKMLGKYGIDIDKDPWNLINIEHVGSHPKAYHEWVKVQLKKADEIAKGDTDVFKRYIDEKVRAKIEKDPGRLDAWWWKLCAKK